MKPEIDLIAWKKKSAAEYWSPNERYAIVRRTGRKKPSGWYVYERLPRRKRRLLGGPYSLALAKLAVNILILHSEQSEKDATDGKKD